ncbi:hypothetical protein N7539_000600 [Penicillium diatomitis]|uniref:Uncharacterized protein n=1 Tax=Penicillium diatomitis TaxID=2819901 RepID=A0A9W9XNG7_9EURO|nr:uncharacterized protein N7539_000600 [Penicillium diatomitis]KAJ5495484.1 hypothetical protein N7539_000600 [Penicillium diatomitis]
MRTGISDIGVRSVAHLDQKSNLFRKSSEAIATIEPVGIVFLMNLEYTSLESIPKLCHYTPQSGAYSGAYSERPTLVSHDQTAPS